MVNTQHEDCKVHEAAIRALIRPLFDDGNGDTTRQLRFCFSDW